MVDLRPYRKLHSIRMIAELVRRWWKLEIAFADASGYVIDHADGNIFPSGNDFCRMALFSKEGFRRCNDSIKVVRDRLKSVRSRTSFVHQCHLGFDVVASPIYFGDELAGFLFTGGAYHQEPPAAARQDLLRKVKEFSSPDPARVDEQYTQVPRLSAAELAHLAELIEYGAEECVKHHRELTGAGGAKASSAPSSFAGIVGEGAAMRELFALLTKIVRSESTVLVHGESGTGKELIARAIHYHGPRAKRPFVVQNCSAFNDNLLESALFGHVRGAFTGAVKDQKGLFEVADGGSFFLDEIGDMSPALQVKLLRVLQEGTFTPVGATKPVSVDVRIIAASHKDLTRMVERGEFREDLYYRVNVLKVSVPPLRDRIEDLPRLVDHFLKKHHPGEGAPPPIASETLEILSRYNWPGNIRELENEMERMLVLGMESVELGPNLLSPRIRDTQEAMGGVPVRAARGEYVGTLRDALESVEAEIIAQGLIRTHWNKSQLAKELGISRSNLIQKCANYGLEKKDS